MKPSNADDIRKAAPRCSHNFHCLDGKRYDGARTCCGVTGMLNGKLLFVAPRDNKLVVCEYHLSFGNGHICTCPVHAANAPKKPLVVETE